MHQKRSAGTAGIFNQKVTFPGQRGESWDTTFSHCPLTLFQSFPSLTQTLLINCTGFRRTLRPSVRAGENWWKASGDERDCNKKRKWKENTRREWELDQRSKKSNNVRLNMLTSARQSLDEKDTSLKHLWTGRDRLTFSISTHPLLSNARFTVDSSG